MLSVENLGKGYGGQDLFTDISFKINPREKIGLVGRNGHGKTTLMRIITGEESPDTGEIKTPKNYRTGYLRQHFIFEKDTVLEECMIGLPHNEKDHHWKAEKILAGLGFKPEDLRKNPNDFSGGYQVRLNLGKVLVSEPDLLLLDEPTNYLDIASIRWIQQFLKSWVGSILLITHDRGFMDSIVTHTIGIHRKKIKKIPGDTEKYYTQLALEEEIYEKTRLNDEKKRKEVELFINRFRAKATLASMVQSRVKALDKKDKLEKLDTIKELEFSFRSLGYSGKQVIKTENISFSYDKKNYLFKDFSINIGSKDRICIVGKNGKGKTTLLKCLAGIIETDEGSLVENPGVVKGVFEQTNILRLDENKTIEDELLYSHNSVNMQLARNIAGCMMFPGDAALKKISVLSGGEKSRVMLGKLLVTPVNLLMLDEPTNHLDMESCDSLLSAIDQFEGAVVMVTHNERFLHAIANRLIVFKNDKLIVFNGSYQEFLEKEGWDDDEGNTHGTSAEKAESKKDKTGKKEVRKLRSAIIAKRSKELKPVENKMKKIESEIEKFEDEKSVLNDRMLSFSSEGAGDKIQEIAKQIHDIQNKTDELYENLEELSDSYEKRNEEFEKELNNLNAI